MSAWRQGKVKKKREDGRRGEQIRGDRRRGGKGDSCCYVRTSCKLWPFGTATQCCRAKISWALWASQDLPALTCSFGFYLFCVNLGYVLTICECVYTPTVTKCHDSAVVCHRRSFSTSMFPYFLSSFPCLFAMPRSPCPGCMVITVSVLSLYSTESRESWLKKRKGLDSERRKCNHRDGEKRCPGFQDEEWRNAPAAKWTGAKLRLKESVKVWNPKTRWASFQSIAVLLMNPVQNPLILRTQYLLWCEKWVETNQRKTVQPNDFWASTCQTTSLTKRTTCSLTECIHLQMST